MPRWNPISISGYHMREAGATAAQELAFTLANGLTYVQAAVDRGLDVDEFAPRLSFFFNAHNDFLEEVAKFRAARRLWASLMRERFHREVPRASCCASTCGWRAPRTPRSSRRTTSCARRCRPWPPSWGRAIPAHEPVRRGLGLPTEKAARIRFALRGSRTSGAQHDRSGGRRAHLEALTDELKPRRGYSRRSTGGMLAAIETGFVQHEIHLAAYRYQQDVEADAPWWWA
jgi:methylmalonyl-CoA mutase N-terminal domain/subunit